MSRRRQLLLSVLALAAGGALLWAGLAVLQERDAVARAGAALAAPVPPRRLPAGDPVAETIARTGGVRRADGAALAFDRAGEHRSVAGTTRALVAAEARLEPLATAGPGARRAWAATLHALLERELATLDRHNAKTHLARSIDDLRAAIAADPRAEDAKFDLELLLTQQHGRKQSQRSRQSKPSRRQPARRGAPKHVRARATLSPAGSGW